MLESDYAVKPVLRALLSSDFFYGAQSMNGIIKGPVDYMIELLRQFHISNPEVAVPDYQVWGNIGLALTELGQGIGAPPAVAGWPAYYAYPLFDKIWISRIRLDVRLHIIKHLSSKPDPVSDPAGNLAYDLIAFVSTLPHPAADQRLIEDAIDISFCVPPGNSEKTYLQGLLNKGVAQQHSWGELWTGFTADKKNGALKEEVTNRLRATFKAMLTLPEYQLR